MPLDSCKISKVNFWGSGLFRGGEDNGVGRTNVQKDKGL